MANLKFSQLDPKSIGTLDNDAILPIAEPAAGTNASVTVAQFLNRGNHNGSISSADVNGLGSAAFLDANDVVQLTLDGKLPVLDGSNLTEVDASTLASYSSSYYLNRGNHNGTISASDITGLFELTTKGGLHTHNGSAEIELTVGTNGKVLSANSGTTTGLEWLALGTAAALDYGTGVGDLVRLDPTTGELPAIDGSNLTNIDADTFDSQLPAYYLDRSHHTGTIDVDDITNLVRPTTKGDLLSHDGTTEIVLPMSTTNGQVLTVDTLAGLTWATPTGGSSSYNDLTDKPLTTKGDLLTRNATTEVRLSVGTTNGQVLTVDSSQPEGIKWGTLATVATSGSYADLTNKPVEFYQSFTTAKTANYTITQGDHGFWIPCSTNAVIITLPTGLLAGTQVIIDRQGTATVTFQTSGGATMVSKSTAIVSQYGVVHAVYNSTGNYWRLTGDL